MNIKKYILTIGALISIGSANASNFKSRTETVGLTSYTKVSHGSRGNIYLIPNCHQRSHTLEDELSLSELITNGRIDAIALENRFISNGHYNLDDVSYGLRQAVRKHGTKVLGTQDPKTYERAVRALEIYFMHDAVRQYDFAIRQLKDEGLSPIDNRSCSGFIQQFGMFIENYRYEILRSEYPTVTLAAQAFDDIVFEARNDILIEELEKANMAGITNIGVKFGSDHIEGIVEKLQDYNVFVADEQETDNNPWADIESNGPEEVINIKKFIKAMYDYRFPVEPNPPVPR